MAAMDKSALPYDVQQSLSRLVSMAERRGWVTYSDLNAVIPQREYESREVEAMLEWLADRHVEVVDNEA